MRVVIQRVSQASIKVEGKENGKINHGLVILVGFEDGDSSEDIDWIVKKTLNLRVFNDNNGVMNLSIQDIDGELLVASQFTLHASTKKGNRPSYVKAAKPDVAIPLYENFLKKLIEEHGKPIKTGKFGAFMEISLINDGPVTIAIDSKNKE